MHTLGREPGASLDPHLLVLTVQLVPKCIQDGAFWCGFSTFASSGLAFIFYLSGRRACANKLPLTSEAAVVGEGKKPPETISPASPAFLRAAQTRSIWPAKYPQASVRFCNHERMLTTLWIQTCREKCQILTWLGKINMHKNFNYPMKYNFFTEPPAFFPCKSSTVFSEKAAGLFSLCSLCIIAWMKGYYRTIIYCWLSYNGRH